MKTAKPVIKVYLCMIVTLFSVSFFSAQGPEKKVKYHENGQIESETFYNANNEPVGIWKYYHENGQLEVIGKVTAGTFGKPVLETGEWVAYYSNGTVSAKGKYNNGIKTGVWIYYHDNGKVKATGAHGNEGWGALSGDEEGLWKYYYPNGNLQRTGSFEEGERVGEWKFYHENGVIEGIAHYELDRNDKSVSHGKLQYYDDRGKLEKVETWEMGSLISSK